MSQGEAIDEAARVDLPVLALADRLIIRRFRDAEEAPSVTLKAAGVLKEVRELLRPTKVPPSGGLPSVSLAFCRGDTILRRIWVMEDGEWGFVRKTSDWSLGREPKLWLLILKHFPAAASDGAHDASHKEDGAGSDGVQAR